MRNESDCTASSAPSSGLASGPSPLCLHKLWAPAPLSLSLLPLCSPSSREESDPTVTHECKPNTVTSGSEPSQQEANCWGGGLSSLPCQGRSQLGSELEGWPCWVALARPQGPLPTPHPSPSHPHTATTLSSTVCQRACHRLRNWCQAVCFVFHCVCMGLVHCPSNVCAAHVSLTGVNLREGSLVLCSLDPSLYPLMVFVHLLKSLSASAGLGCIPEVLSNFSRHLSHKTRL